MSEYLADEMTDAVTDFEKQTDHQSSDVEFVETSGENSVTDEMLESQDFELFDIDTDPVTGVHNNFLGIKPVNLAGNKPRQQR